MSKKGTRFRNKDDQVDASFQSKIEKFTCQSYDESTSWEDYENYFLLLCKVKGLGEDSHEAEEARRDLLLAYVGPAPLRKVSNFLLPLKIQQASWDEVVGGLRSVYKPKKTIFSARLEFEQCVRQDEETFSNFVIRLKDLAQYCKYGANFDERVRDRFAGGINFPKFEVEIRQRWPEGAKDDGSKLKLGDLLELASSMERANREIDRGEAVEVDMNKVSTKNEPVKIKKREEFRKSKVTSNNCSKCGLKHELGKCSAYQQKCFNCEKVGHFSRVCRLKKVNKVNEISDDDDSEVGIENLKIYDVKKKRGKTQQARIKLNLNNVEVNMEFDSGARASMIGRPLWEKIGSPGLDKCNARYIAYGNNILDIMGECYVKVTVGNMTRTLKVAVVNGNEKPLFGLPWMLAFDMKLPPNVTISNVENQPNRTEEKSHKPNVKKVIEDFEEVFSDGLGKIKGYQAKIHVKEDTTPKNFSARRVPFPLKKRIENELSRLVEQGVIEKVDPAETPIPWATPTVNIEKNDGSIRICGDFRVTLNPNLILETTLLPTFEELTSKLAGGKEFSIIDLRDAYLQLEVVEEHRKFLVIATHTGYYRYLRLPFGVSSSPGIFQRYMEKLLEGLPQVGVLLDDIIVTGKNENEHIKNLREVLRRMKEAGLKAKSSKCKFFETSVKYLGHVIDQNGIHPTEEKIKAIRDAPSPTNVKQLRSFLGSINYYEKFIPRLHAICSDLHKLTGTNSRWKWTENEEKTFRKVKMILSSEDTVVPYDETKPLVLISDASENGLGSVLMHRFENGLEKPIAFASRTLMPAEKRYSNIDREALAIVYGLRKFHQYIYGREFTLVTDHKPLQRIFGNSRDLPKVVNNRLVRWAIELNQYSYQIEYRKGEDNVCADVLSRLPIEEDQPEETCIKFLNVDKVKTIMSFELLKEQTMMDKEIKLAKNYVLRNAWPTEVPEPLRPYKQRKDELVVEDDLLLWFGRVVVPKCMRSDVLKVLHSGHPGIASMRSVARYYVWWPNMDHDIEFFVKRCTPCQENRDNVEEVPLYPWNIPDRIWERVHIDLAGPVNGCMWLVGIDALSKWVEVDCMKTTTSAAIITRLRSWFSRYGLPTEIVTDNGPQFASNEIEHFFKRNSIRHIKTTPYHPKSNGLVERLVRTLKRRYYTEKREEGNSTVALQNVLFSYRNSPQKTTGRTPAEMFLGRRMPTIFDNLKPNLRKKMEVKLWKEQMRNVNEKKVRSFEEGEEVWIKNENSSGWSAGRVKKQNGPYSYEVLCGAKVKRKHADQMRKREGAVDDNRTSSKMGSDLN